MAYELIWDFLDTVNEHGADRGKANGQQLHLALAEALDPDASISDYYRHHPWREDGGYLRALVDACRSGCSALPSYSRVRSLLAREAARAQVLALNHELDPACRDALLQQWAQREFDGRRDASWFELSGAASASLTVHVLLALAAEPACTENEIDDACAVYYPWLSLATTMLDSYVDQVEDEANGDHSYIAHYATPAVAARRVYEVVEHSARECRRLRNGHRHAVIAACMVAMYLSRDSARTPALRETTDSFIRAGGSLTRVLLPVLRLWRIAYGQRAA